MGEGKKLGVGKCVEAGMEAPGPCLNINMRRQGHRCKRFLTRSASSRSGTVSKDSTIRSSSPTQFVPQFFLCGPGTTAR